MRSRSLFWDAAMRTQLRKTFCLLRAFFPLRCRDADVHEIDSCSPIIFAYECWSMPSCARADAVSSRDAMSSSRCLTSDASRSAVNAWTRVFCIVAICAIVDVAR